MVSRAVRPTLLTKKRHPCTILLTTITVEYTTLHYCRFVAKLLSSVVVVDINYSGVVMKKGIHPNYVEATVSCACGNSFQTLSIKPLLKIDVCSKCHPFFTGQQRILDTAGRVERFRKRFNIQEEE